MGRPYSTKERAEFFRALDDASTMVRQMKPRTPALRFAHALAAFQEEAHNAFAKAADFSASKYDSGLPLGELVRQHREALDLSLAQLAERAGCTKSHVWEIEDGRARNPTVKTVAGLARALGLSLPFVFYAALRTVQTVPHTVE